MSDIIVTPKLFAKTHTRKKHFWKEPKRFPDITSAMDFVVNWWITRSPFSADFYEACRVLPESKFKAWEEHYARPNEKVVKIVSSKYGSFLFTVPINW